MRAAPASPVLRRPSRTSESRLATGHQCPRRCGSGARQRGRGLSQRGPHGRRLPDDQPCGATRTRGEAGKAGRQPVRPARVPGSRGSPARSSAGLSGLLGRAAQTPAPGRRPRPESRGCRVGTHLSARAARERQQWPGDRWAAETVAAGSSIRQRPCCSWRNSGGHVGGAGPALALPLTHNAPPRRAQARPFAARGAESADRLQGSQKGTKSEGKKEH